MARPISVSSSFYDVLNAAVADFAEHGFDSEERLTKWQLLLTEAARRSLMPERVMMARMKEAYERIYHDFVDRGGVLRQHPGIERFRLAQLRPELHAELNRRLLITFDLIRLNRGRAIEDCVQRFSGWASSVPAGGSRAVDRAKERDNIRKSVKSLPYRERLVLNDQGHKFNSALNEIVATDGGAIAGVWHSHWRQANYDYRPDHKERDRKVYMVRGNWALERGLVRTAGHDYTDQITKPAEEVNCQCRYQYLYHLREIKQFAPEMLTAKGREAMRATEAPRRAA